MPGFLILQCDGGGHDDPSSEEESETSVEATEDEDEEEEDDEEEEEDEESEELTDTSSDSNENDDEEEEEEKNVTRRPTRSSLAVSTSPSIPSRGRVTRQKVRDEMPTKRLLRSRKKSPVAGSRSKVPQVFPCPNCKKEFGSKVSVNRHGLWCKPKKSSPKKTLKSENKKVEKKVKQKDVKKENETAPSPDKPRRRGRPRKTPVVPSRAVMKRVLRDSQTQGEVAQTRADPVVPEDDFLQQRSPQSSPGIPDTSSESDYEQREYAANAHQLRSGSLSIDVVTPDPPQTGLGYDELEMSSGIGRPVTCPQCKMTYRTTQGYENHLPSCVAYSSEEDDMEDDEEVDVVHDIPNVSNSNADLNFHEAQEFQNAPSAAPTSMNTDTFLPENSVDVAQTEGSLESSSSEESEDPEEVQEVHVQNSTLVAESPLPAGKSTHESHESGVPAKHNHFQGTSCPTAQLDIPHSSDTGAFEKLKLPTIEDLQQQNVSISTPKPIQLEQVVISEGTTKRADSVVASPNKYLPQLSYSVIPNISSVTPPNPLQLQQPPPQQYHSFAPASTPLQVHNYSGSSKSSFQQTSTTTSPSATSTPLSVPFLLQHHSGGNPPTYTQAQLMPGTVLHNSAMNPQQMCTMTEPLAGVPSQTQGSVGTMHFPGVYTVPSQQDPLDRVQNMNGAVHPPRSLINIGGSHHAETVNMFHNGRNELIEQRSTLQQDHANSQQPAQYQQFPSGHGLFQQRVGILPGGGSVPASPFCPNNTMNGSPYVISNGGQLVHPQPLEQNPPLPHHLALQPPSADFRSQTVQSNVDMLQQNSLTVQHPQMYVDTSQPVIEGTHSTTHQLAAPHQQQQQQFQFMQNSASPGKANENLGGGLQLQQQQSHHSMPNNAFGGPQNPTLGSGPQQSPIGPCQMQVQHNQQTSQVPQVLFQQQNLNQSTIGASPIVAGLCPTNVTGNSPSNQMRNSSQPTIVPNNAAQANPLQEQNFPQGSVLSPELQHQQVILQQLYQLQQQQQLQQESKKPVQQPQFQLPQNSFATPTPQWPKGATMAMAHSGGVPQVIQPHQPAQTHQHVTSSAATVPPTPQQPPQEGASQMSGPQQQQLSQMIQQIAQFTDSSGNTFIILTPTPTANGQQSQSAPQQAPVATPNAVNHNNGSVGLLNLIANPQNIPCQQQQAQQPSPQLVHCPLNGANGFITHPLGPSMTPSAGPSKSAPCPCPTCKEKTTTATAMEKFKKVLPYPSATTSAPDQLKSIHTSSTTPRPISIRPANLKQQKSIKTVTILQQNASPQLSQQPSGLRVLPLPVCMKPLGLSGIQSPVGMGVIVDTGTGGITTSPCNVRSGGAPNSNVAVVRPMENPLQKLSDQISQIESTFLSSQHQVHPPPSQLQQVPHQQQQSPIPAATAPYHPQGPHLTLVTASPPSSRVSIPSTAPAHPTTGDSPTPNAPITTAHHLTESNKQNSEGVPRLTLVDHGSPVSSPNKVASTPSTPVRNGTMAGVKRKAPTTPTSSPGTEGPTNKSIKVTLRRKEGGDSYSINRISGSASASGTMKSLKIKGQIKSGEHAGTSTDVAVVPCIHTVPIPFSETGDVEGNRTIAEDGGENCKGVSSALVIQQPASNNVASETAVQKNESQSSLKMVRQ